jgi:hypothetical protein
VKLGRIYTLTIYSGSPEFPIPDVTISSPLTLKFQLSNNFLQSANIAHFVIYNLSAETREHLYRDYFDQGDSYRGIIFEAGYESEPNRPVVFQGDIQNAYSYREGPDWITEIDAYDGGMAIQRAQVGLQVESGYDIKSLIADMVQTMEPYGVSLGAVGDFTAESTRGKVVSGNTWRQLVEMMAAKPYAVTPFINKGKVYVVNQNEYIAAAGAVKDISSDTGMIGTPRRQNALLKVTMMFEPRLEVGQIVTLHSDEPSVTLAMGKYGDYKVADVSHSGVISGAVNGNLLTVATFFLSPNPVAVPS